MNPRLRVLYVEDEEDDVFMMREAFRRLGVEACFYAVEDGQRAISWLTGEEPYADRERHPLPACVLLDLNLPIRSGFEVLAWLRGQPQFQALPVVVFSSSDRPEDIERARRLGATDYLVKPTSGLEFSATARKVFDTWLSGEEPEGEEPGEGPVLAPAPA